MGAKKKPRESVSGTYTAVPHAVMDSTAFLGASSGAKALLLEVMRQHTGSNNGHMQLSVDWLKKSRGFRSATTIQRAKDELLTRHLLMRTRRGGMGIGPDRFALTWLPITNFCGLDLVTARTYHQGAWRLLDPAPVIKTRTDHSGFRNGTIPISGTDGSAPVPVSGTLEPIFGAAPVPETGSNECNHYPEVSRGSSQL